MGNLDWPLCHDNRDHRSSCGAFLAPTEPPDWARAHLDIATSEPILGTEGEDAEPPFVVTLAGKIANDLHVVVFRVCNNRTVAFQQKQPIVFEFRNVPVLKASVSSTSPATIAEEALHGKRPLVRVRAGKIEFTPGLFRRGEEIHIDAFTDTHRGELCSKTRVGEWVIAPLRTRLTPLGAVLKSAWTALVVLFTGSGVYAISRGFYDAGWQSFVVLVGVFLAMWLFFPPAELPIVLGLPMVRSGKGLSDEPSS